MLSRKNLRKSMTLIRGPMAPDLNMSLDDVLTTPYEKILRILNDIQFYLMSNKGTELLRSQLNWVIQKISSHSIYSYEILGEKEKLAKIEKSMPEVVHFANIVDQSNNPFKFDKNYAQNMAFKRMGSVKMPLTPLAEPSMTRKRSNKFKTVSNFTLNPEELKKLKIQEDSENTLKDEGNLLKFENSVLDESQNQSEKSEKSQTQLDAVIADIANTNTGKSLEFLGDLGVSPIHKRGEEKEFSLTHKDSGENSNSGKGSSSSLFMPKPKPRFSCFEVNYQEYSTQFILSDQFNIFELKNKVGYKKVLPIIGRALYDHFGLDEQIINTKKLQNLLESISSHYNENVLYHNAMHGADVSRSLVMYIINSNFEEIAYTKLSDILSLITSALGHDLGHPGLNANYLINARNEIAITYNDVSVLENYHSSFLFKLLLKEQNNILDWVNLTEYKMIRKRIINQILSTDMAIHGKVVGNMKTNLLDCRVDDEVIASKLIDPNSKEMIEKQQDLFNFTIHAADLGHNAQPFNISLTWVELLSNEFWLQGDRERSENMPISFLCDRNNIDIPSSQLGFLKAFLEPVFETLTCIFPSLGCYYDNVNDNIEEWEKLKNKGEKLGFPSLKKE